MSVDGDGDGDGELLKSKIFDHAAEAERSLGPVLYQVAMSWQRAIDDALQPLHLNRLQFVLLLDLTLTKDDGKAITQAMLGRRARIDPMTTSQVLRTLETKGLIERRLHPADTRAKSVVLTIEGADVVERARVACTDLDRRFFATIDSETIAMITTSLIRLLNGESQREV